MLTTHSGIPILLPSIREWAPSPIRRCMSARERDLVSGYSRSDLSVCQLEERANDQPTDGGEREVTHHSSNTR